MKIRSIVLWAALAFAGGASVVGTQGCGGYASYVEGEDSALGKVVVYRNGIAYYERKAHVEGGHVTLTVPFDKVDDFLKSLTVADAKTGQPLPVAYPTAGANNDNKVDMTIQVSQPGVTDVVLTYITEAPAWKPSYRVVIDKAGKVALQGWAIVDNTSGETWKSVAVGVGSSSALSFRYDLRSVRSVWRDTLKADERFAVAPPMGGATRQEVQAGQQVVAQLDTLDLPAPEEQYAFDNAATTGALAPAVPDLMPAPPTSAPSYGDSEDYQLQVAEKRGYSHSGGSGRKSRAEGIDDDSRPTSKKPTMRVPVKPTENNVPSERPMKSPEPKPDMPMYEGINGGYAPPTVQPAATPPPADPPQRAANTRAKVKDLATKLNTSDGEVVLETYAQGSDPNAVAVAEDKANWLRNELIREGVAPARLKVEAKKGEPGQPYQQGVRLVQAQRPAGPAGAADPTAEGEPVGESHFQSKTPMTVERGTSAMVAVLDDGAEGDVVYLYDAESERGNRRYAFKAIRFKNPTNYTLETGPMTVYGDGQFVGEGLTEPIPPRATAVVPFALDRQVVVEPEQENEDRITRLVTLQRGILRTEVAHQRVTRLKITSVLADPTRVFLRHTVGKGWTLDKNDKTPTLVERLGDAHLFAVDLPAGATKTIEIIESTPLQRALDLRSPEGIQMVKVFLEGKDVDLKFAEPMKKLLAIYSEMADIQQGMEITSLRIEEFRERMLELQDQILTLKGVPNSGALMANLQAKLREMSDGVQKGTIDIVNAQQKLMLARIRFQDGVAELRLETAVAKPDLGPNR